MTTAAAPMPAGAAPGGRPAYWLPVGLAGLLAALAVPLYGLGHGRQAASVSWYAYAPLTRTVYWPPASTASYSSSLSIQVQPGGGISGIPEGWYWTAVLLAGFAVTGWWLRRAARQAGTRGPGPGYLLTGLALIALAAAVPLLLAPVASFPVWLWLTGAWDGGTFALLVIAAGVGMLAWRARSRMLAIVTVAFTSAAVLADWPSYRTAWLSLTYRGHDPATGFTLVAGQRPLGQAADLLPAAVLLAAAGAGVLLSRRARQAI